MRRKAVMRCALPCGERELARKGKSLEGKKAARLEIVSLAEMPTEGPFQWEKRRKHLPPSEKIKKREGGGGKEIKRKTVGGMPQHKLRRDAILQR